MNKSRNKTFLLPIFLLLLGLSDVSVAAISWNFASTPSSWRSTSTYTPSSAGPSVTVSGWANTGTNGLLQKGWIRSWSGLGVCSQAETTSGSGGCPSTAPQHAMDNDPSSKTEFLLLALNQAVKLTDVTLGWYQSDSDITVLAYGGADSDTVNMDSWLSGKTYSGLVGANQWTKVGDYWNLATTKTTINTIGIYSRYWMIGAYNSVFGGPSNTTYDYVKLAAVSGLVAPSTSQSAVPEPATLCLFSAGLLLFRSRRQVLSS